MQAFRILYILCIIGALSLCPRMGFAQSRDTVTPQRDPVLSQLLRAHATLPTDTVDVPFEDRIARDHPSVQVMINGHGPFRLGIETGAPVLVISPQVARAIGHSASKEGNIFAIDALTIGTAQFAKIAAVTTSGALGGLDGLLGLNVYYDLLMILDYTNHRMRLTRGGLPPANGTDVLALQTLDKEVFGIECWINGTASIAELDTQNDVPFLVVPSQVAETQFVAPPRESGFTSGPGIGLHTESVGRLKGTIRVGTITFQQPAVKISQNPYPALQYWNIGWPVLRRFTMTLDQHTRRVRLTSAITSVAPPLSLDSHNTIAHLIEMRDTVGLTAEQVTRLKSISDSLDSLPLAKIPTTSLTPSEIDALTQRAIADERKRLMNALAKVHAILTPAQWNKVPDEIKNP